MAHHKQALKRHRQSLKRQLRNKHYKTMLKNAIKKVLVEKANKSKEESIIKAFQNAESVIMHAATKGAIPKKRASRKVARLARKIFVSG